MSTEVRTGVDHRFATPAQHGEGGGTQRASGKLMMYNSQFHRCGDIDTDVGSSLVWPRLGWFPVPFAFLGEEGACTCKSGNR